MSTHATKLSLNKETGELTKKDGVLVCTLSKETMEADPIMVDAISKAPELVLLISRAMLQLIMLNLLSPTSIPEGVRKESLELTEEFTKLFGAVPGSAVTANKTAVNDDK